MRGRQGDFRFEFNGRLMGWLGFPVLVIQEGGYRTRTLGVNTQCLFVELAAIHSIPGSPRKFPVSAK